MLLFSCIHSCSSAVASTCSAYHMAVCTVALYNGLATCGPALIFQYTRQQHLRACVVHACCMVGTRAYSTWGQHSCQVMLHRSQSALSAILLFNSTGCAQGSAGTPSSLLCSDEFHHTAGLFVSGPPGHSSCVHSCCSAKYLWMGLSPVTVRIVIGTLVYFSSLECVCCKTHAQ